MPELKTCEKCRRAFEVIVVGGGMTSAEPEPLVCPYCGYTKQILTSGRFVAKPAPEGAQPPAPKADR